MVVFDMMNSLPNWQQWSNFSKERVEGLVIEYSSTKSGEGAVQKWEDARGKGKMWITQSQPHSKIEYDLKFDGFPTMKSTIEIEESGQTTTVVWSSSGKLPGGPFYGYFALLFPGQMQYEYQQSLKRLKELVEK